MACGLIGWAMASLLAPPALAHKPSDGYLTLTPGGEALTGRLDLSLRDLDHAIGLDGDGDGRITWGEVKAARGAIVAYALARLAVSGGEGPCLLRSEDLLITGHSDGAYAVLMLNGPCPGERRGLAVRYDLFFDGDPQHRGHVRIIGTGAETSTILAPDRREWRLDDNVHSVWTRFATYFREGVTHIATGVDHLLFLVTLLLPAVLRPGDGPGRARHHASLGQALAEVAKVVTAFTLAHSLTLALATFGWVHVRPAVVEPLIAATIVVAALNNVRPVLTRGLWAVAFLFGLVHGLGFADALKDLGMPPAALVFPLVSFNLGVEAGQLAVIALLLPLFFLVRTSGLYRRVGVPVASITIAAVGGLWFLERALGVPLLI